MKPKNKFLLTIFTLAGISTGVHAQETASATATATIVTPISITKNVDMNFGNVAVQSTSGGTVVLTPAGVRSKTGGVTLPTTMGSVSAASFTISGTGAYTYTVTLPSTAHTISSGTNTMTVTVFTSTPSGANGALTAGEQTLNVGATLNVGPAQPSGVYLSDTPFDVTVNYN
ncbi:DUF4402 domain-containing protein [Chitinophaga oryziterrae]|uniref:DUF4402 domain-containing protein n=1 Tax=Chitinophaga oryziterrae TaxID=1031224 RepID=A0A6N8J9N5_9BACT|nr:DUF4402 domain-containing protein [Chitinophaga oryziterrae]MVT41940.1 DUF4402 domain-containing protein [Chitinophaga oryziterrae]